MMLLEASLCKGLLSPGTVLACKNVSNNVRVNVSYLSVDAPRFADAKLYCRFFPLSPPFS